MLVGVGGDTAPQSIDLGNWLRGVPLDLRALEGQLGGTAKPFDPNRRVIAKPEHGSVANVFIGTPLNGAIFKDVSLANASFANVSLAKAKFDDIDFSNSVITSNCNFKGMQIAGVAVSDLFAIYEKHRSVR